MLPMCHITALCIASLGVPETVPPQPVWRTIVVHGSSEAERLAVEDVCRYIWQVSDALPVVVTPGEWQQQPCPAIVVGQLGQGLLANVGVSPDTVGAQGFVLHTTEWQRQPVILVGAAGPTGLVNGLYGLLRAVGFGFYLGSEAVPASLPELPNFDCSTHVPALGVRGVLPWYNFFNSPTAWDPVDHRAFVDQLIRMGANFVGYHTYDAEPFAAIEEDGGMVWGRRLASTAVSTWGTRVTPTDDFPYGIDKLFGQRYFGAATTGISDDTIAIRAEQQVLSEGLDYARRRGLHTCTGFEANDDPTDPEFREVFLKRLENILALYPSVDMLWIWQSETQGAQGFPSEQHAPHHLPALCDPASPLNAYAVEQRRTYARIVDRHEGAVPFFQDTPDGQHARATEAVRMELVARLALNVLETLKSPPRLILSGWGGEKRLLSAEYYDGLDKTLPKKVVFSSLDFITMLEDVDRVYHELPEDRERWPIAWLEADGDQWHPQPQVHVAEKSMGRIFDGGSQGVLGIHWRTRDIEENFAYLVERSWEPSLTSEVFFDRLARTCYDGTTATAMARIHCELDALGYRWAGGYGQAECGYFTWGGGDEEKVARLRTLRAEASALLPDCSRGKTRLQWVVDRMDWVLASYELQERGRKAETLLGSAKAAATEAERRALAREALELMDDGLFERAFRPMRFA